MRQPPKYLGKTKRQVRCQSGIKGLRTRIQNNYKDFESFEMYCELYGNHLRLGFTSPQEAWDANPVIELSVNTGDYRKVYA